MDKSLKIREDEWRERERRSMKFGASKKSTPPHTASEPQHTYILKFDLLPLASDLLRHRFLPPAILYSNSLFPRNCNSKLVVPKLVISTVEKPGKRHAILRDLCLKIMQYDVFLSFRGTDIRSGVLSHLIDDLSKAGVNTFVDESLKGEKA
ncbi:hypothetical protein D0Y65_043083 [Glycine soja]|uniref:TIR domain-containing protein n=1 Tax=Glycine soja TaxID=3848 RepID=A0A445GG21_GLYSO|nr:hypothetical protein D0Y65_043083 [Glycine soja]